MKENVATLNSRAIELASQGCFSEAIACFVRALKIEKANSLLWYNLGITYRDLGDFDAAKNSFLVAYEINTDDEDLLETLALTCYARNEIEEAFTYCIEGLELNPHNAHVWNTIGVLYFSQSDYVSACEAFEKAVTLFPYYYDALYNLSDTYDEMGNLAGAIDCRERLLTLKNMGYYA
ncbi:MAG: tetratricopeptide repeat protein [Spirochaetales bacterium]